MTALAPDAIEDPISSLERFLTDNPELQQLEKQTNSFNIFEAVGITRQEIRHSHFLAFLLDPSQSHGLGDRFLKDWLTAVLKTGAAQSPVRLAEILLADLEDTEVRREWKNIDLLCYSRSNNLVIAVENKVGSGEHSNQLERYYEIVESHFSGCKKLYFFLSPDGIEASESIWQSCDYGQIAETLSNLLQNPQVALGREVALTLAHYEKMIRRHVMQDSQVEELCRKIYRQHRQALELIFEHRPDMQSDIADFVQQLVEDDAEEYQLCLGHVTKKFIAFSPSEWDELNGFDNCEGWQSGKIQLLCEWFNQANKLAIVLAISPASEERKREIYDCLRKQEVPGLIKVKSLKPHFQHLCKFQVLMPVDYEQPEIEALKERIKQRWGSFLEHELPKLRTAVAECFPSEID